MGTMLRLATVNILKDGSRWVERRALLIRGLEAIGADLIALQEVRDPLGTGTADWIAGELGGYSVHACPKTGRGSKREGVAVLSRLPVEWHEPLDLGSQRRTAQVVQVRVGGRPVAVVNGHYFWPVGAHAAQVRQVERVLDRLKALEPGTAVLSCGDFNAAPGSPPISLMCRSFTSAHAAHHGREPEYTCPTPLRNGGPVRRRVTAGALRAVNALPGGPWRWTLDYIFVGPGIRVVECDVFLDRPAPDDPTLYASDHLGLFATLEIPGIQGDLADPPASPGSI